MADFKGDFPTGVGGRMRRAKIDDVVDEAETGKSSKRYPYSREPTPERNDTLSDGSTIDRSGPVPRRNRP